MGEFLKKEREFVVPGDLIVESMDHLPGKNAYREGEGIYAKKLGLISIANRVISVIPLNSIYIPKVGDMVVAEVKEIQSNGWILEINSPYEAFLPLSGVRGYIDTTRTRLSSVYDMGERVYAKITVVNQLDTIHASMYDMEAKKLIGGRLMTMNPAKIPRLIGRAGSMIGMIKRLTKCNIVVGHNGVIWLDGSDIEKAMEAVKLVDDEAYTSGLTDRVGAMLGEKNIKEEKDEKNGRKKA
jgi:exosome complex component RRP4